MSGPALKEHQQAAPGAAVERWLVPNIPRAGTSVLLYIGLAECFFSWALRVWSSYRSSGQFSVQLSYLLLQLGCVVLLPMLLLRRWQQQLTTAVAAPADAHRKSAGATGCSTLAVAADGAKQPPADKVDQEGSADVPAVASAGFGDAAGCSSTAPSYSRGCTVVEDASYCLSPGVSELANEELQHADGAPQFDFVPDVHAWKRSRSGATTCGGTSSLPSLAPVDEFGVELSRAHTPKSGGGYRSSTGGYAVSPGKHVIPGVPSASNLVEDSASSNLQHVNSFDLLQSQADDLHESFDGDDDNDGRGAAATAGATRATPSAAAASFHGAVARGAIGSGTAAAAVATAAAANDWSLNTLEVQRATNSATAPFHKTLAETSAAVAHFNMWLAQQSTVPSSLQQVLLQAAANAGIRPSGFQPYHSCCTASPISVKVHYEPSNFDSFATKLHNSANASVHQHLAETTGSTLVVSSVCVSGCVHLVGCLHYINGAAVATAAGGGGRVLARGAPAGAAAALDAALLRAVQAKLPPECGSSKVELMVADSMLLQQQDESATGAPRLVASYTATGAAAVARCHAVWPACVEVGEQTDLELQLTTTNSANFRVVVACDGAVLLDEDFQCPAGEGRIRLALPAFTAVGVATLTLLADRKLPVFQCPLLALPDAKAATELRWLWLRVVQEAQRGGMKADVAWEERYQPVLQDLAMIFSHPAASAGAAAPADVARPALPSAARPPQQADIDQLAAHLLEYLISERLFQLTQCLVRHLYGPPFPAAAAAAATAINTDARLVRRSCDAGTATASAVTSTRSSYEQRSSLERASSTPTARAVISESPTAKPELEFSRSADAETETPSIGLKRRPFAAAAAAVAAAASATATASPACDLASASSGSLSTPTQQHSKQQEPARAVAVPCDGATACGKSPRQPEVAAGAAALLPELQCLRGLPPAVAAAAAEAAEASASQRNALRLALRGGFSDPLLERLYLQQHHTCCLYVDMFNLIWNFTIAALLATPLGIMSQDAALARPVDRREQTLNTTIVLLLTVPWLGLMARRSRLVFWRERIILAVHLGSVVVNLLLLLDIFSASPSQTALLLSQTLTWIIGNGIVKPVSEQLRFPAQALITAVETLIIGLLAVKAGLSPMHAFAKFGSVWLLGAGVSLGLQVRSRLGYCRRLRRYTAACPATAADCGSRAGEAAAIAVEAPVASACGPAGTTQ